MNAEIEARVNEMLVKSRIYVKAINARDEALVVTCESDSRDDEATWQGAVKAAEVANAELAAVIDRLHKARTQRP